MIVDYTPTDKGARKVAAFKESMSSIVEMFADAMEDGRTKALFITKMEEASMFGTKAILEKPNHHTGKIKY